MSNSIATPPAASDSATPSLAPRRSALARVRKGLKVMLHPAASPVAFNGKGSGEATNLQALESELSLLKTELAQYRKEQAQFEVLGPFGLGTEHVAEIVPPIAGAVVRGSVGSPSMAGYLVSSDAWQILLSKFLKPNSQVLDIGCGCGKMAQSLAHHPYIKKFIGFDVIKSNIDFCNQVLAPRIGPKFEFHRFDVYSEYYNPQGTLKASELVFPADDGSIDLAFGCSLFTHLLEPDAKHYLREVRRVLSPSGVFMPSLHVNPAPGRSTPAPRPGSTSTSPISSRSPPRPACKSSTDSAKSAANTPSCSRSPQGPSRPRSSTSTARRPRPSSPKRPSPRPAAFRSLPTPARSPRR